MGKSVLLEEPFVTNQQINSIIPNEELIDIKYLYYVMSCRRDELFRLGSGGSRTPILNKGDFEKLTIALPDLKQQKVIADKISFLDEKIELNRKTNEILEQMARAIYKSWFIDFDPVHAKAAGNRQFGMDDTTAALFPDSFDGDIPMGWQSSRLDALFDVNTWTLSAKDPLTRIEYIEISGVSAGAINEIVTYDRGQEPSRARRRLRHFDTVISTVRPDRAAYFLAVRGESRIRISSVPTVSSLLTCGSVLVESY